MTTPLYDALSQDYDRFVNWRERLAMEMPFLQQRIEAHRAKRVLDVACGTGMHALALAKQGYQVIGTDISQGMIKQAQRNAAGQALPVTFHRKGFGELEQLGVQVDAILCLGNSLPHLLTPTALADALCDFATTLRPNGLLLIQNRNFDQVLAARERWMGPQSHREADREWLFVRFYDWLDDGLIDFNVLTLQRTGDSPWTQSAQSTRLWPITQTILHQALHQAGFVELSDWGDLSGSPYDPTTSGNLVTAATRA